LVQSIDLPDYLEALESVDLTAATPMSVSSVDAGLPLDEYLIAQSSWYRSQGNDVCTLAACAIERIARSVRFHRVSSVAELLAVSPLFKCVNLDHIETPDDRPMSWMAEGLDRECEGYLLHEGTAARLIAWALLDVAEDADFFHADTLHQFEMSKAAWEMAQLDYAMECEF